MPTDQEQAIKVARRFDASAERVFDAWLDPATTKEWLYATDDGEIVRCDIDARVGGSWTIVRRGPSPEPPNEVIEMEHTGGYVEVDRPRRLVFTFGVPTFSDETTTVSVDLVPDGEGCEVTLTNQGVPEEWAERTEQGWRMILDRLGETLS